MPPTVVLDNGAATLKAGLVGAASPTLITNAVVRSKGDRQTYCGHEIARCRDYAALHFRLPFEKGLLVDWDAQKAVWDGVFSDEVLAVDTTQATLLVTEPYFNLPNIQDTYDQLVFEEYEFAAYFRCTPASMIPHGDLFALPGQPPAQCTLVVDAGFSFTHVVPLLDGQIVWTAVKRLDVGGKLLTNQLKELVSFRQWNMMDETHIMNDVKERCCFVSLDYNADLEACRVDLAHNPIVQEYILPDLSAQRGGRVRAPGEPPIDGAQILHMGSERFAVPELLFRPDDIGLDQAGLPATIAHAISCLPADIQGMFWANIGLIGGCAKFAGFRARLQAELQSLAPHGTAVRLTECAEPITAAYRAAHAFAADAPRLARVAVTRAEYAEGGSGAVRRRFDAPRGSEAERMLLQEAPAAAQPPPTGRAKGRQPAGREDERTPAPGGRGPRVRSAKAGAVGAAGTGSTGGGRKR
ncbi:hypothetical protein HYPSUDRAFT_138004 [Hypholoma sublateritium FD-334 SS-4]|uniref:Actin-like protein ARP6 n=1 Tax=Hypholoma sublateritium (strain FD-334 SS-4) TaxID=945553 RepID=A0A0D2MI07_HYPSF|nr:hypothetical protein HYPSUDRAFT_138004 [Hypholoma sublateritium FD-334 SS-4]